MTSDIISILTTYSHLIAVFGPLLGYILIAPGRAATTILLISSIPFLIILTFIQGSRIVLYAFKGRSAPASSSTQDLLKHCFTPHTRKDDGLIKSIISMIAYRKQVGHNSPDSNSINKDAKPINYVDSEVQKDPSILDPPPPSNDAATTPADGT